MHQPQSWGTEARAGWGDVKQLKPELHAHGQSLTATISGLLTQVFRLPEVCEEVFGGGLCCEEETG